METDSGILIFVVLVVIVIIPVLICRWIFRINEIVSELKRANQSLYEIKLLLSALEENSRNSKAKD